MNLGGEQNTSQRKREERGQVLHKSVRGPVEIPRVSKTETQSSYSEEKSVRAASQRKPYDRILIQKRKAHQNSTKPVPKNTRLSPIIGKDPRNTVISSRAFESVRKRVDFAKKLFVKNSKRLWRPFTFQIHLSAAPSLAFSSRCSSLFCSPSFAPSMFLFWARSLLFQLHFSVFALFLHFLAPFDLLTFCSDLLPFWCVPPVLRSLAFGLDKLLLQFFF
jgi:hypothetical protein